ncbi:hypothetical protein V8C42DRAFT_138701 [Trichoderma barbatum]
MAGMTASRDILQRKNDELAEIIRDKSRKLSQTQELYTKVKRKAELGQIERAACDAVDNSIRSVPQSAISNQESHAFFPLRFHDTNERSYPLSHGLRLDTTGVTKSPSGSNPQRQEREGLWARNQGLPHGLMQEAQPYRQTTGGQGRADILHPIIASNTGLPRGDSISQSEANSPGFLQRGNPWAGVGLTSGLKVGQPTGQTGTNGPLGGL